MNAQILLLPILVPLAAGLICLLLVKQAGWLKEAIALCAGFVTFALAVLFFRHNLRLEAPWLGGILGFSLRLYNFSGFILLAGSFLSLAIILYSTAFMRDKPCLNQFYAYFLFCLAFSNGAVLADNLLIMLFFWEGLLLSLFGMIAIGTKAAFRVATKAFIIVGISDLCMLAGIALTAHLAGTLTISEINLGMAGPANIAFVLLLVGALAKAGAMPFHSWIPDAATEAPLPFMALVPAVFEKLLGIYLLTRICLDMFRMEPGSGLSILLMSVGAVTIILAVMMALIQKEYKRLLSYHAISQVGYMILGIGTGLPAGIVGGLFHMLNNALYKCCLFLTAGAVEKQTGSTRLEELGGLAGKMPLTCVCFLVAAVSISGMPPFNGFFSKELVYDAALERGLIFYLAALAGSFFTAASFLKLGHAAFFGRLKEKNQSVKEAGYPMLLPMMAIAFLCILFGVCNFIPLKNFIQPALGEARLEGRSFAGFSVNLMLFAITVIVLFLAVLNHLWGVKSKGSALSAVDHIHYAPVLSGLYAKAEKKSFDPYELGMKLAREFSRFAAWCDRRIDWLYDTLVPKATDSFSAQLKAMHSGSYSLYLSWSLIGLFLVAVFLMYAL